MRCRSPKIPAFFLLLLFCCNCQDNRYTGFSYQAQTPPDKTTIEGNIVDLFTGEPVPGVKVSAEGQEVLTTFDGNYLLSYQFTGDERFNRPIEIIFSKNNYIADTSSLVIGLFDNRLNAVLEYGAPIIEDANVVDSLCTTVILDYQNDVENVTATAFYFDPDSFFTFAINYPMSVAQRLDSLRTEYFTTIPDSATLSPYFGTFTGRYDITAVDRRKFVSRRIFYVDR